MFKKIPCQAFVEGHPPIHIGTFPSRAKAISELRAYLAKNGKTNQTGRVEDMFGQIKAEIVVIMMICPKCGANQGGDWTQCEGNCPIPVSPHFQRKT